MIESTRSKSRYMLYNAVQGQQRPSLLIWLKMQLSASEKLSVLGMLFIWLHHELNQVLVMLELDC